MATTKAEEFIEAHKDFKNYTPVVWKDTMLELNDLAANLGAWLDDSHFDMHSFQDGSIVLVDDASGILKL